MKRVIALVAFSLLAVFVPLAQAAEAVVTLAFGRQQIEW